MIGDVQTFNAGKDDDGTPIYFELETQPLNFGNKSHLKQISDDIAIFSKNGQDSVLQAKTDQDDYKKIPVNLDERVKIGRDIDLEGKEITFKWSGEANESSPIFEGLYIDNIDDKGMING